MCRTSGQAMIDTFTLLMVHGLLGIAAIRLIVANDLDSEEPTSTRPRTRDGSASGGPEGGANN